MDFWKREINKRVGLNRLKLRRTRFSKEKFFYEKASYLKNGMSILDALHITGEESDETIKSSLLLGKDLSSAMEESGLFQGKEICLIRLSEETGDLHGAFLTLYQRAKEERELKQKMLTLLVYPLILLCSALLFLLVAIYFIAPPISDMLTSLKVESALLSSISGFSRKVPFPVLLLVLYIFLRVGMKFGLVEERVNRLILGRKKNLFLEMQLMEQFQTLNQGGMNLISIFDVLLNEGFDTKPLKESIEEGLSLEEAFEKEHYSTLLLRYFKLAGETGNYEEAIDSYLAIQRLYFKDLLQKKTALIEPVSILIMGIIVFFVSFLIMMPLLSAYETL